MALYTHNPSNLVKHVNDPAYFLFIQLQSDSLAIYYPTGDGPPVAIPFHFIVDQLSRKESWNLRTHKENSEKAVFVVKNVFTVSLISHGHYFGEETEKCLEIQVKKIDNTGSVIPIEDMCRSARETIEGILCRIKQHQIDIKLAFKCTCKQTTKQHLMRVVSPTQALCLYEDIKQKLSPQQLSWLPFVSTSLC